MSVSSMRHLSPGTQATPKGHSRGRVAPSFAIVAEALWVVNHKHQNCRSGSR